MAEHLELGRAGEKLAFKFLCQQGYDILARNFKSRAGEIDLIAYDGEILTFVEVKTRVSAKFGQPFEAVDARKQRQIQRAANEFMAEHKLQDRSYRFDILSIRFEKDQPRFELLKNAF